jgi:DNA-binding NarL/FixJ family response regulator
MRITSTATSSVESKPIRVVIASVQKDGCRLLRNHLESETGIEVLAVATDSHSAFDLVRSHQPDVLLIELALTREYASRRSALGNADVTPGMIVVIESARIQSIVEAFGYGANGVVRLTDLPSAWRSGIQSILAGRPWVEDNSLALLLETARKFLGQTDSKTLPDFGLTLREVEIAGKIAAGYSNKEVGVKFSICERTVKHHLTNIFRKLGVSSRLELAVFVRDTIGTNAAGFLREESHR